MIKKQNHSFFVCILKRFFPASLLLYPLKMNILQSTFISMAAYGDLLQVKEIHIHITHSSQISTLNRSSDKHCNFVFCQECLRLQLLKSKVGCKCVLKCILWNKAYLPSFCLQVLNFALFSMLQTSHPSIQIIIRSTHWHHIWILACRFSVHDEIQGKFPTCSDIFLNWRFCLEER